MSANTATTALTSIGQIAINVHDVDRAVAFYRDALGMKFLFQAPNMAFLDCGGVRLMLSLPEVRFDNDPHLVARMPDHELWMAFFRDTEGNPLELMSEVRAG